MKTVKGYHISEGFIYTPDGTPLAAFDKDAPRDAINRFVDVLGGYDNTLLDMFAMAALPSVTRAGIGMSDWPQASYDVAAAMIQERLKREAAKRVSPADGEDGG